METLTIMLKKLLYNPFKTKEKLSNVELARKYTKDASCKHCKGSGRCTCNYCRNNRENNYMMVWEIKNPKPLPYMLDMRDLWKKQYRAEIEKSKKWARTVDTCSECVGKGIRPEIDYVKLDDEVQQGIINEHEKYAILQEIGKTFGASYFQY